MSSVCTKTLRDSVLSLITLRLKNPRQETLPVFELPCTQFLESCRFDLLADRLYCVSKHHIFGHILLHSIN